MNYISLIGIGISLVLAAIGALFAYRSLRLWRYTNVNSIYIELTKDKAFLSSNFKLVLLVGALASLHIIFELIEALNIVSAPPLKDLFTLLYSLDITLTMLVLYLLAFKWHQMLSRIVRWDMRWIKTQK